MTTLGILIVVNEPGSSMTFAVGKEFASGGLVTVEVKNGFVVTNGGPIRVELGMKSQY